MSDTSNRALERAQELALGEAAAGVAAASAALSGDGAERCVDCGADIPPQRRQAMPSADRCVDCQSRNERAR